VVPKQCDSDHPGQITPDGLMLIYLVELDIVAEEQAVEPGAFPPVQT
jgi:hypothetical protein